MILKKETQMEMTRRMFTKGAGTGLLVLATGGPALFTEGCTAASVFTDIVNWAPVGKAAVQGIITLLQGAGIVSPGIGLLIPVILTGFDDLLADVKIYQSLNPPPAGALAKIVEIFHLIVTNFQSMLAQLQINGGPIVSVVIGLAQVILSTIAGFLQKLPAAAKFLTGEFKVGNRVVTYTA